MQHKKKEQVQSIGLHIRKLDNSLKRNMQLALSVQDGVEEITATNGFIIRYLYLHQNETVYQRDLERTFNIGKSAVTSLLNRMEEIGLIERIVEKNDARLKRIVLTEKGREQVYRIEKSIRWLDRKQLENITPQERETFFAILEKIQQNTADIQQLILSGNRRWVEELNQSEE